MESKRCTGCGLTKPTSEFYHTSRDGLMARCKLCWCEEMRVRLHYFDNADLKLKMESYLAA